jgi:predicted CDP-diglyceride synthetase/phosphatidate cytidylyltransferase
VRILLAVEFVFLLVVANGAPVIAKTIFGKFLAQPIDGGRKIFDGRPLFGASKTIRGVVSALLLTTVAAPLVGISAGAGALVGLTAMIGDLASSFLKRRMGMTPSRMAVGLDQIPESLFPAVASQPIIGLTLPDVILITLLFTLCELTLSRVLFRFGLRDRPY